MEEQETEGSGFVYAGWIGFHVEMFPLRTYVGYKHPTPFVIGRTVLNPNIDDNRCLQRCLILASEGGHKIVANCKIDDATVYNKWWKQPDKNKVFGVTIHDIEEAIPKHFMYIKDLSDFKHRIFRQSDAKNRNTARNVKCRFCDDFFGSRKAVHAHEVQAHRELIDESDQYDLSNEESLL